MFKLKSTDNFQTIDKVCLDLYLSLHSNQEFSFNKFERVRCFRSFTIVRQIKFHKIKNHVNHKELNLMVLKKMMKQRIRKFLKNKNLSVTPNRMKKLIQMIKNRFLMLIMKSLFKWELMTNITLSIRKFHKNQNMSVTLNRNNSLNQ